MPDSIQASSSIPLPLYQTALGQQDPLPATSPKEIKRTDEKVLNATEERGSEHFEDYLNQQSVTTLEKAQTGTRFDAADEIGRQAVYQAPGQSTPI